MSEEKVLYRYAVQLQLHTTIGESSHAVLDVSAENQGQALALMRDEALGLAARLELWAREGNVGDVMQTPRQCAPMILWTKEQAQWWLENAGKALRGE